MLYITDNICRYVVLFKNKEDSATIEIRLHGVSYNNTKGQETNLTEP
jgi:hypothetical protein